MKILTVLKVWSASYALVVATIVLYLLGGSIAAFIMTHHHAKQKAEKPCMP